MKKQIEQTKLVIIKYNGNIPELGGIAGPVLNPTNIPMSILNKLIMAKRGVYEVNPNNHKEMIPLSAKNIRLDNFHSNNKKIFELNSNPIANNRQLGGKAISESGDFTKR